MMPTLPPRAARRRLRALKVLHTLVWAFFVACIVGMPLASWRGEHRLALALAAAVGVEVLVLGLNCWRCPMTAWAAAYTDERRANFDIYLPEWLAANNQRIFGTLYAVGLVFVGLRAWVAGA